MCRSRPPASRSRRPIDVPEKDIPAALWRPWCNCCTDSAEYIFLKFTKLHSLSTIQGLHFPFYYPQMSSEAFNPNPTVFVPTKTKTSSVFAKRNSIWLNDPEIDASDDENEDNESEEVEEIDQDEIFGMLHLHREQKHDYSDTVLHRPYTLDI